MKIVAKNPINWATTSYGCNCPIYRAVKGIFRMNMMENLTCTFWMYPIEILSFSFGWGSKEGIFSGFKGIKSVKQINIKK